MGQLNPNQNLESGQEPACAETHSKEITRAVYKFTHKSAIKDAETNHTTAQTRPRAWLAFAGIKMQFLPPTLSDGACLSVLPHPQEQARIAYSSVWVLRAVRPISKLARFRDVGIRDGLDIYLHVHLH